MVDIIYIEVCIRPTPEETFSSDCSGSVVLTSLPVQMAIVHRYHRHSRPISFNN